MSKDRVLRVEELLKREISAILLKDLEIPGLGFITITDVKATRDLQQAKVYVSIYADQEKREHALQQLKSHSREIHQILKPRLHMRYIPNLEFVLDTTAEYGDYIARRLMEIKKQDEKRKRSR